MKKWKIGSILMLVILTLLVWLTSGILFARVSTWINYPIAMVVFILGLGYINKYYGKDGY
nr:hypothetical protein [Tissierella sp.]